MAMLASIAINIPPGSWRNAKLAMFIGYIVADLASQVDLALAGQGIAILPCFVGDQREGLVCYSISKPKRISDVWVLSHPDFRSSARVRKVAKFCATVIKKQQLLFSGK